MRLFKRLALRLVFGRVIVDLPPHFFDKLNLSQLYDRHRQALPKSPLEARTREELSNRDEPLQEWVKLYKISPVESWAEDLTFRRIRNASATYDEWYQVSLTFPDSSPLKKIAQQKMKSTSRS
ncbi:MAG TPA: hypothetical protein VF390_01375 [Patescibacteria group bacterium]